MPVKSIKYDKVPYMMAQCATKYDKEPSGGVPLVEKS